MTYHNIREEELKNKVGADWFNQFDTTEIIGNIDFTVFPKQDSLFGRIPLLWAEAKTGNFDIASMFVQLILTIGKARTFDKTLPPAFLGAFDFKKIAFVPYISVQDIFYLNDFNWNVTPSNHDSKEFKLIKERIETTLKNNTHIYDYQKDKQDLEIFIKNNIANSTTTSKIKIDKNNFIPIYLRWLEIIKPIINVNWDELKVANILDSDFYLADLFVDDRDTQNIEDDTTIRDSLFVVFDNQGYRIAKENIRQMFDATINIKVKETYIQFWKRYKRPPIKEFQDYIIERRDLLVPQDIRERKGAFFTPRKWVELSQKYLTDYLGENWQDDYYVWDCAAGTGNLLAGLTNKFNIYASTLDQADVNVMHERVEHGAHLLASHCFQFDFLNDEFTKLPMGLQDIINDPEKRKKLVIYINPPYAEAANRDTVISKGENKTDVAVNTKIYQDFQNIIGIAGRELFAQFFARIYSEISGCHLSSFSTMKYIQGPNFVKFREYFLAEFKKGFIVPADTFDNVKGQFPIGFLIWDTGKKNKMKEIEINIFNEDNIFIGSKVISTFEGLKSINDWLIATRQRFNKLDLGYISCKGNDFQNTNFVFIINDKNQLPHPRGTWITDKNIKEASIYLAVRHVFEATWLNDRDQFLFPNDGWVEDTEFQNDCLAYTLFHGQNRITSKSGVNHWIPFAESEVNAGDKFASSWMTDYMRGRMGVKVHPVASVATPQEGNSLDEALFVDLTPNFIPNIPLEFSLEAQNVFNAGRALWKYYHTQPSCNVNASLYDIREYFQGRNSTGKMNNKSSDETYTLLIAKLRDALKILSLKIQPKVYEYGFLKG